jgi:hypothetical protein
MGNTTGSSANPWRLEQKWESGTWYCRECVQIPWRFGQYVLFYKAIFNATTVFLKQDAALKLWDSLPRLPFSRAGALMHACTTGV